jgi:hypothetical protein
VLPSFFEVKTTLVCIVHVVEGAAVDETRLGGLQKSFHFAREWFAASVDRSGTILRDDPPPASA